MARKTNIMHQLEHTLRALDIDPETTIQHTRYLLQAYNKLAWLTAIAQPTTGDDINHALKLITAISHNTIPDTLTQNQGVQTLCNIMQQTLTQIQHFPQNGAQYHTILQHAYFDPDPLTDNILMDQLHLERTTYYSRKREAITLYGYLIYTKYLPQLHQALR